MKRSSSDSVSAAVTRGVMPVEEEAAGGVVLPPSWDAAWGAGQDVAEVFWSFCCNTSRHCQWW